MMDMGPRPKTVVPVLLLLSAASHSRNMQRMHVFCAARTCARFDHASRCVPDACQQLLGEVLVVHEKSETGLFFMCRNGVSSAVNNTETACFLVNKQV